MKKWNLYERVSCWQLIDFVREVHQRKEDLWDGNLIKRIKHFEAYTLQEVSVLDIHRGLYCLDDYDIQEYAERSLETMPPIILGEKFGIKFAVDPSVKYDVVDGNHRFEALLVRGKSTVLAFVPIEDTRIATDEEDEDGEE